MGLLRSNKSRIATATIKAAPAGAGVTYLESEDQRGPSLRRATARSWRLPDTSPRRCFSTSPTFGFRRSVNGRDSSQPADSAFVLEGQQDGRRGTRRPFL